MKAVIVRWFIQCGDSLACFCLVNSMSSSAFPHSGGRDLPWQTVFFWWNHISCVWKSVAQLCCVRKWKSSRCWTWAWFTEVQCVWCPLMRNEVIGRFFFENVRWLVTLLRLWCRTLLSGNGYPNCMVHRLISVVVFVPFWIGRGDPLPGPWFSWCAPFGFFVLGVCKGHRLIVKSLRLKIFTVLFYRHLRPNNLY